MHRPIFFTLLLSIVVCLSFYSCGPSKEEIAKREKEVADSLARVQEFERIHLERIEVGKDTKKQKLEELSERLKSELDNQQQELAKVKEFQFGRSRDERDRQIREIENRIDEISSIKRNMESDIPKIGLYETYEFQNEPKQLVEYLFKSAKSREFNKLINILDSYGEFDASAFDFVLVKYASDKDQEKMGKMLENGRIMNEPTIENDLATFEIAYGVGSDQLMPVQLVLRKDKWFLKSIGK